MTEINNSFISTSSLTCIRQYVKVLSKRQLTKIKFQRSIINDQTKLVTFATITPNGKWLICPVQDPQIVLNGVFYRSSSERNPIKFSFKMLLNEMKNCMNCFEQTALYSYIVLQLSSFIKAFHCSEVKFKWFVIFHIWCEW